MPLQRQRNLFAVTVGLFLAGLAAQPAAAQTPEEKGLAIAQEADRRDAGFGDSRSDMKMILYNANGDVAERELSMMVLEVPDPDLGDKSLSSFSKPRDVDGTALLSHAKILEPDDQWLYLPSLKRVKRISSVNKSGPFMGSEFAFEDMAGQEVGKYSYKWLRDEPCPTDPSLMCFVSERVPLYENSGYTFQVTWIDQQEYRPHKVEYYNRRRELLKTLTLTDYKQYLGKHWRAHKLRMENHLTHKSTDLIWDNFEFKTGLDEGDFTQNALKRAR